MSAITVEEFVNKVSYKVDTESLKRVLRVTDKLYAHLGKALLGVSSRMDLSWRNSMSNMAKASRRSARAIAEDGRRAGAAWRIRQPGTGAPTDKGGGTGGVGMGMLGLVGRLGGAYSVYSLGRYAVQSASGMEDLNTQFGVLLGSEEKAKALVASIQKLAATTPLTSMGVANVTKQLIAYGVPAENAVNTVRQLGDIAGGNQERLGGLAIAYGQVVSKGKLQGEEAMQFAERGFNITRVMADNLDKFGLKAGTTTADILNMQQKGLITPAMVAKAFAIATSEGGQFFQSMEKGAKTLSGLYSTFVDNFQMALVKAMQPVLPLMKEFVDWLGQLDWAPVVNAIVAIADILIKYVIPSFKILRDSIMELGNYLVPITIMLIGAFGPRLWTMLATSKMGVSLLKSATKAYGAVVRFLGLEAIQHAGRQVTANTMVRLSWANMGAAAKTAGVAMKTALASLLTPMNMLLVGMLGIWALYNKAKKETAGVIDEEDKKMDMLMIDSYRRNRSERTLTDLRAQRDAMEARYAQTGALDGGKLARLNERIASAEALKADYETRYERVFGKKPESSMLGSDVTAQMKQLQSISNNMKNVTNNVTVNNNIATTVDDKGQTPLSIAAVKSVADTAVRSALNVKILGILEGV